MEGSKWVRVTLDTEETMTRQRQQRQKSDNTNSSKSNFDEVNKVYTSIVIHTDLQVTL